MHPPPQRLDAAAVFRAEVSWKADTDFPWLRADYCGETIFLRVNPTFPDVPLYSLLVDEDETVDFDDLPDRWRRGPLDWSGAL